MHAKTAHFPTRRIAASLAIAAVVAVSGCAAAGDNSSGKAPATAPAVSAAPSANSPTTASSAGPATAGTAAAAPGASVGAATPSHFDQLPADSQFQRFIVKYRDGTAPGRDADAARERLDAMQDRTGIEMEWLRRLGVDADVFKTDRPLDRKAAAELMDRFSADPDVEYIEVDGIMTLRTGVDVPPVKPLK
ncbi:hypothetical protein INQ41_10525 [Lysobacter ciconiae]|uniref:Lipoprotein n=1 Tax=Novilysobacter ciconiae TaxID=2781022 RepID=A0A7S6UF11_9GAMM|nr:hypothetical protein [Lysobacter ciconiae]QOW19076.1 hypothetical protein INQ41_10525 [Lysobacter ciconiae]